MRGVRDHFSKLETNFKGKKKTRYERKRAMQEGENWSQAKRDEDIIYIMKQQLQQQQGLLEEVQQQNKLPLSLYQKSLEKK